MSPSHSELREIAARLRELAQANDLCFGLDDAADNVEEVIDALIAGDEEDDG